MLWTLELDRAGRQLCHWVLWGVLSLIKYVHICHFMWLSDEPCDIFVIFYILLWGIGNLKNLTNFSRQTFESHLESRSSAFKFCVLSTFPHYTPKGLHDLSQLKIIQLFMCGSQNNSNIWFAVCVCVMRNSITLTCGDDFSLKIDLLVA